MENSLDACVHVYGACMLYVDGYPCRIGAEESCRTSLCRIAVLEVSVKTVMHCLEWSISEINNWRSNLFLIVELIELLGS